MERTGRDGGQGVDVLLLDLDGFRQVNDIHGHQAGDRVLGARIAAEVVAPISVTDGTSVTVGVSVGAAAGGPAEADRILHEADLAMYRSKNTHRAPTPAR